jgi:hypothetical protein
LSQNAALYKTKTQKADTSATTRAPLGASRVLPAPVDESMSNLRLTSSQPSSEPVIYREPHRITHPSSSAIVPYHQYTLRDEYQQSPNLRTRHAPNRAEKFLIQQGNRLVDNLVDRAYKAGEQAVTYVGDKIMGRNQAPKRRQIPPVRTVSTQQSRSAVTPVFGTAVTARSAPVSISRRVAMKSKPKMNVGKVGGVNITHREMIGQIISSGSTLNFSTNTFVINPGKFGTFPWLSALACNFDKYVMRRLRFTLVSSQPTSIGGRMGIGYDIDSTDPPPSDRNEFFSLTYHAECAPWDTISLDIPCDSKPRFVNSHTATDSKLIDIGQIIFMSDAIAATNSAICDVIVEYSVELLDPQQAIYTSQMFSTINVPFTSAVMKIVGPVLCTVDPSTTDNVLKLNIPQGYYTAHFYAYNAAALGATTGFTIHGGTGSSAGNAIDSTSHWNMNIMSCRITANDGQLSLTVGTVAMVDIEKSQLVLTRISATAFNNGFGYSAAIGIY